MHHLILGGQRSGKSRFAERLGMAWLALGGDRHVSVVATALGGDDEMRARIERHRLDRHAGFETVEAPYDLAACIGEHSWPNRLLIVDCLTLWATNWLMPAASSNDAVDWAQARATLLAALADARGPVALVSNEIGWGVIPMGHEVRQFVDELGRLNQDIAQRCTHITLMAAGQPWTQQVQKW
ncbi:MAG: bifunctional adenosylcobinamide kinase/adenosylcobinamide-phosphate guanylyltransferase [Acidobacteriota bacterium]